MSVGYPPTAHALPLATRDGRGHPPPHTHAPCGRQCPQATRHFDEKALTLSVAPTPMQGRSGRCACPHYMPASRSSMGAWCVSSVFVCQAVMWRHAMPLEHGTSREHVRGGRGAWYQHHEHMISRVRGYCITTYSYHDVRTYYVPRRRRPRPPPPRPPPRAYDDSQGRGRRRSSS